MERECNVGLEKWEVADNIDMNLVVQDFEEYFEVKFQKRPLLVKRNANYQEDVNNRGNGRKTASSNPTRLPSISNSNTKLPPNG